MGAISLNKKLLARIAFFMVGVVGTLVLLKFSGVQRVNSNVIVFASFLVVAGLYFNRRRAR